MFQSTSRMLSRPVPARLWKIVAVSVTLCIVPTFVFLCHTGGDHKYSSSLQTHRAPVAASTSKSLTVSTRVSGDNASEREASFMNLSEKDVVMRRFPYRNDVVCHNFSLSLYEENTFEIIGLVSYPGSGNTWTRHLIQLATGVYTGSFYFDMDLFSQASTTIVGIPGFLGEKEAWYSGETIVQKFHEKYDKRFDMKRAILLMREPFPAILSFANFMEGGHTGNAFLLPYHHKDWPKFLIHSAYQWLALAKSWLESPVHLLVIHYENLRLQPVENVKRICKFIKHPCSHLVEHCFQRKLEGSFKRLKSLLSRRSGTRSASYPDELRKIISGGIDHLNGLLLRYGHEPLPLSLYQHYTESEMRFNDSLFRNDTKTL